MSAEQMCNKCPVKNAFGGRCQGTENQCIADTTVTKLIEMCPNLDRASAEALINSKVGCLHTESVKTKHLPLLSVRQNPKIEEPEEGDPATFTGHSFRLFFNNLLRK